MWQYNGPLLGTDNKIAAFYKDPSGYKYALLNTMTDLLLNGLDTLVTIVAFVILNKCDRMENINLTLTETKINI